MHTKLTKITPRIAYEMLAVNTNNRPVRGWWVAQLAEAIKRGEWKITHQGIAFNSDGVLIDGQHRLHAVVLADIAVEMLVTTDIDPKSNAHEVMDQGVGRTVSDALSIDKRIAEPIRLCTTMVVSKRPTVAQIKEVANTGVQEAVASIIAASGTATVYFSSAPIRLAAAVRIMLDEADELYIKSQYRALVNLDFDAMSPIAQSLVRQKNSGSVKSINRHDTFARGMKVFDPTCRNITRLKIHEEEVARQTEVVRKLVLGRLGK